MHFIGLLIGILLVAYVIAKTGKPATAWGWVSHICIILACWLSIEALALLAIGVALMVNEIKIVGERDAARFLEESLKAAGELMDEHKKSNPAV